MRTQAIRPRRVHRLRVSDYRLRPPRQARGFARNATVGALQEARLVVGAFGRALAVAKDLDPKHAIKQVDRFFSNTGVDAWSLFASWVPYVVGSRPEILVAIDWTDYDPDNQSTIALYLVTKHGRATPLIWKTVKKSALHGWRNEYEDQVLERLHKVLPASVKVTVLADRGFGDQKFYELLKDQLGFDFVVRFRGVIKVTSAEGEVGTRVDAQQRPVPAAPGCESDQGGPSTRRGGMPEGEGDEGRLASRDELRRQGRRRDRRSTREGSRSRRASGT